MDGRDRRRSARHLLGLVAEVHVGPVTVQGVVEDVSQHGMGLVLPQDLKVERGETIWILAQTVAPVAITATVQRIADNGVIGVEFLEVLTGEALDVVESLPLPMTDDVEP
jgi:hypothetical protein